MQSNEIKARLAEVLRKVEAGQEVEITRHGKAIARLTPMQKQASLQQYSLAVVKMQGFNKHALAKDESIADFRKQGQR
ncbi:MAG: type II toxin-antitoxin system prevent-host-death family antitoxin [Xanthomonadales bacterium]|nr:type II toxin-antitoxin system prevent-host-death family antitoxin [Xanthomonadales bacterium]